MNRPLTPEIIRLECDRLTGSYLGLGSNKTDYGWLQANTEVPRDLQIFYFEVKFHNLGVANDVTIGFANSYHSRRQLGIFPGEVGYCVGSRKLHLGSRRGIKLTRKLYRWYFGIDWFLDFSRFENGDVIGCGVDIQRRKLLFTKYTCFGHFSDDLSFC